MLTYDLPQHRIAMHPLEERDASKLLVYRGAHVPIEHTTFRHLAELLSRESLLVVNTTRVIAARLAMRKPTGGLIEVLITETHKMLQNGKDVQAVFDFVFSKQLPCATSGLAL